VCWSRWRRIHDLMVRSVSGAAYGWTRFACADFFGRGRQTGCRQHRPVLVFFVAMLVLMGSAADVFGHFAATMSQRCHWYATWVIIGFALHILRTSGSVSIAFFASFGPPASQRPTATRCRRIADVAGRAVGTAAPESERADQISSKDSGQQSAQNTVLSAGCTESAPHPRRKPRQKKAEFQSREAQRCNPILSSLPAVRSPAHRLSSPPISWPSMPADSPHQQCRCPTRRTRPSSLAKHPAILRDDQPGGNFDAKGNENDIRRCTTARGPISCSRGDPTRSLKHLPLIKEIDGCICSRRL